MLFYSSGQLYGKINVLKASDNSPEKQIIFLQDSKRPQVPQTLKWYSPNKRAQCEYVKKQLQISDKGRLHKNEQLWILLDIQLPCSFAIWGLWIWVAALLNLVKSCYRLGKHN